MKPHQVLLFIVSVMVCLAALCFLLPGRIAIGDKEVRWPTMAKVMGGNSQKGEVRDTLDALDTIDALVSLDTLDRVDTMEVRPVVPKVVVDENTDSRIFLQAFYASLAESGRSKIRVLHYGDSQIEEDRMTQQIREGLQKRYGGRGVGLMPLAQTIPTITVRQELRMNGRMVTPQQGPRRYMVYAASKENQRSDSLYGIMGQVAVMADSLVAGSEDITAVCRPQTESAHYDCMRVFADSSIHYTLSGDTVHLTGKGNVYGLSQESDTGVIVDNIPMRGCLGLVFTKMDSIQIADFCREENVRLIILQFGGNAIPYNEKPGTIQGIVKSLRKQVLFVQSCAPEASILFIGPSDMIRMTDGVWESYPLIAYMDKLLRKMALEENIAYFSLYDWMGGAGSMIRWQENGLAGKDGIHFLRSGARKAGNAIVNWMMEGMENRDM